jgi:hypothetical protein
MNIKALEKIETAWVKFDWRGLKRYDGIPIDVYLDMIEYIDRFSRNKSVKELVLIKLRGLAAYFVVSRNEYTELLNWLQTKFIDWEMYEVCERIEKIKSGIK